MRSPPDNRLPLAYALDLLKPHGGELLNRPEKDPKKN
jgi:hypothetical protein